MGRLSIRSTVTRSPSSVADATEIREDQKNEEAAIYARSVRAGCRFGGGAIQSVGNLADRISRQERQRDRHAHGAVAERRPPGRRLREPALESGGDRYRGPGAVLVSSAAAPGYHGSLSGNARVEQSGAGHLGE